MKAIFKQSGLFVLIITILAGCSKQDIGPLSDIRPAVPITVQNAFAYRPDPTVSTTRSGGGVIQIVLSIPATSGRTIKEISKVALSTSYTQIQSSAATGFFTTTPTPGSGTTATFNTTVAAYFVNKPVSSTNPAAGPNVELANRFYFLVTLDDGSTVVPTPVRVLVLD